MTKDGNSESGVKARISKARGAFAALKNIWKTNKISNITKRVNVMSVLLYTAESWNVSKDICQMLYVFQNKCLRRMGFHKSTLVTRGADTQLYPSCISAPLATNVGLFACFAERLFKSSFSYI